jgi:hypothetical protein
MTLPPVQRIRIWSIASLIVAILVGVQIAEGSLFWPLVVGCVLATIMLVQSQPLKIGTILVGIVLLGYVVGNRGFAQLSLAGNIPLLPAEFVLLVAGAILIFKTLAKKVSPVPTDLLNLALLTWIVLSSLRLVMDLRTYGFFALRDFAAVYYAGFFFIAQDAGRTASERRFLSNSLLLATGALLVVSPCYELFPLFFQDHLTIRGVPLIYLKGDLVGTFAAAGTLLFFAIFDRAGSRTCLVISVALAALAMSTNNRSSMAALMLVSLLFICCRRWRYVLTMSAGALAAVAIILAVAFARNRPWQDTPVYDAYERVASLADPLGQGNYSGKETFYKGDNNTFRWVWWRLTYENTVHTNPYFGLGWGYDLAEAFEQIYYPEGSDEFAARSPHSIYVNLFGRTGLLGLVPFVVFTCAVIARAFRSIRSRQESGYLWAATLVILVSASFGVVLEGPMGAVVFWSMLGLASAYDVHRSIPPAAAETQTAVA